MFVGVGRLVISIPENRSLKGKRKVVRALVDRLRHKFNAAVAEVDRLDDLKTSVIAIAVVSNDGRHTNAMADEVMRYADQALSGGIVVDRSFELIPVGLLDRGVL